MNQNVCLGMPSLLEERHDRVPLTPRLDGLVSLIVAHEDGLLDTTLVLGCPLILWQIRGRTVDDMRDALGAQNGGLRSGELADPERGPVGRMHAMHRLISKMIFCHCCLVDLHHGSHFASLVVGK